MADTLATRGHEPWLLPDGVEELLPRRAWRLEALRRRVDALERAVYSPVAAGASPPDEPAPDDGSGSVVR